MPDPKMLAGELSLWSAVLLGQGEKDWAELLDQAAAKLARGGAAQDVFLIER
jgi:hypothetical protein